jgi:signal transduction histidine kinase
MSRLTLRARLTFIYGGLLLVAGLFLLGLTYLLVDQNLPKVQAIRFRGTVEQPPPIIAAGDPATFETSDGRTLTADQVASAARGLRRDALTYLLTYGGIALLLVAVVAIVLGWLVTGRILSPLGRITETAGRIAAAPAADRGLHERIGITGRHDELRRLADTFDTMLARLDHAFDGQRRFVSNASHELRTPLTLIRSLVEVAMHRRTASEDLKRLGEVLLDVSDRQERLINGLLLLARSENELTERSPVDLADVVGHVARQVAPEAAEAGVEVTASAQPTVVDGDPVLLERLVQNLVENGIRHNCAGGWVSVAAGPGAGLVITNTGPVVPPYDIPSLFEPFRRLREERTRGATVPGAGLGLSIVRAVARAHGGDVSAVPREGGGLVVTVGLPLATRPVR